jgi:NitT/TauT family transport system permease protein
MRNNKKHNNFKQNFVSNWLPPLSMLFLIIVAMIIVTDDGLGLVNKFVIPAPSKIVTDTIAFLKLGVGDFKSTIVNVLAGYVISIPLGLLIAGLLAQSKVSIKAFGPIIVILAVTPMMVLIPVLVMWTKFAWWTRIVAVILQTTPIIVLNALTGFTNVPREKEELAILYGASKTHRFFKIVVPQAWPRIFTGFRLGVINSTLGIVATEFLILGKGIGYRIIVAANFLKFPLVFGCIIIMALTSYLMMVAVTLIEKRILTWVQ